MLVRDTTRTSQYSNRPQENDETRWWRIWLCKIIYGLWYQKKAVLENMGFPARSISQKEIYREVERRIEMLQQENMWGRTRDFPYWTVHNHNWIERRVNYLATEAYGPRKDGVLMIVNPTAGKYMPNPELFRGKE